MGGGIRQMSWKVQRSQDVIPADRPGGAGKTAMFAKLWNMTRVEDGITDERAEPGACILAE